MTMNGSVIGRFQRFVGRCKNLRLVDSRNLYQLWEQEQLKKVFRKYDVDCVFDIGANYGQYATMLRQRVGFKGLIVSFEPIPEAAVALRRKAKNDPAWLILEQAISSYNGEQTLNIMSGSEFSSLSTPRHDEVSLFTDSNQVVKSVVVKTEMLETAFARLQKEHQFKRPFLKLDTQGFDVEIVSSAKSVMGEFIGLQSELSVKKIYQHSVDFREAISVYQQNGFALSAFAPNNAGHFPVLVETDCIMVRENLLA
jgi:FkbM family methyltransferase